MRRLPHFFYVKVEVNWYEITFSHVEKVIQDVVPLELTILAIWPSLGAWTLSFCQGLEISPFNIQFQYWQMFYCSLTVHLFFKKGQTNPSCPGKPTQSFCHVWYIIFYISFLIKVISVYLVLLIWFTTMHGTNLFAN